MPPTKAKNAKQQFKHERSKSKAKARKTRKQLEKPKSQITLEEASALQEAKADRLKYFASLEKA